MKYWEISKNMKFGLIHLEDIIKILWTIYANISKFFSHDLNARITIYTILTEIMKITQLETLLTLYL